MAERFWQKTYSYQKAEVRASYSSRSYFLILYARRVPHKRPRQVFALRRDGSGGCMAREAAVPRASLHIVLFRLSDDSNDDIHFIIDNEAAIIKAITSHRTLLKTFLIRPEKHAPKIRLSHIFDRHRTLSPVLCVEVSKYFLAASEKAPTRGDIFCAKNDPARVRERE